MFRKRKSFKFILVWTKEIIDCLNIVVVAVVVAAVVVVAIIHLIGNFVS
jgi:hypothetical protein